MLTSIGQSPGIFFNFLWINSEINCEKDFMTFVRWKYVSNKKALKWNEILLFIIVWTKAVPSSNITQMLKKEKISKNLNQFPSWERRFFLSMNIIMTMFRFILSFNRFNLVNWSYTMYDRINDSEGNHSMDSVVIYIHLTVENTFQVFNYWIRFFNYWPICVAS